MYKHAREKKSRGIIDRLMPRNPIVPRIYSYRSENYLAGKHHQLASKEKNNPQRKDHVNNQQKESEIKKREQTVRECENLETWVL
jgi:hypothetical protein